MTKTTEKIPEIRVRLKEFIKNLGISERQFEIDNKFYNGFVGKVNKIDAGKMAILEKAYPDLNINWLVTGEGNMLDCSINNSVFMNDNTIKANNLEVSINKNTDMQQDIIKCKEEEIKFLKHEIEFLKRQNKELLEMIIKK